MDFFLFVDIKIILLTFTELNHLVILIIFLLNMVFMYKIGISFPFCFYLSVKMVTVIGVNQNLIKYVHLQKIKECCSEKRSLCAKTER
jgi:hypothetical protein